MRQYWCILNLKTRWVTSTVITFKIFHNKTLYTVVPFLSAVSLCTQSNRVLKIIIYDNIIHDKHLPFCSHINILNYVGYNKYSTCLLWLHQILIYDDGIKIQPFDLSWNNRFFANSNVLKDQYVNKQEALLFHRHWKKPCHVKILSTVAQLYEISHSNGLAVGEWPSRSFKVIKITNYW